MTIRPFTSTVLFGGSVGASLLSFGNTVDGDRVGGTDGERVGALVGCGVLGTAEGCLVGDGFGGEVGC